jgi:hypothetical protein
MSLGIVIKGPEGIVLAADSRVTLQAVKGNSPPTLVNYDNATKLLSFETYPNIGAVTYGMAVIGLRTAHSLLPEFEVNIPGGLTVEQFSKTLSAFFCNQREAHGKQDNSGIDMTFVVGGYDKDEPYGRVFLFSVPSAPDPVEQTFNNFGITWGGQSELNCRLLHGYDPAVTGIIKTALNDEEKFKQVLEQLKTLEFPIPYQVLPLQDCINLAISMIRSTITFQSLAVGIRGVGGPIDVAIITRNNDLKYVQRKQPEGESISPGVYHE